MEYFEVFNADGTPANRIEERSVVHARGLWHRTVHIWVYRSARALLFQKRACTKDSHPGLWDVSAAGHIDVAESPEQSAIREIREELGLSVRTEELEFIEMTSRSLVSNGGAFIDNEFTFVYLYQFKMPESELSPHPDELEGVRFIQTGTLRNMLNNPEQRAGFVPYDPGYYESIISLVEQR